MSNQPTPKRKKVQSLRQYFTPSHLYPRIPWVLKVAPDGSTGQSTGRVLGPDLLPVMDELNIGSSVNIKFDHYDQHPLVIVSPTVDLLAKPLSDFLQNLVILLKNSPEYLFLVWTSGKWRFRALGSFPENVELIVRVTYQYELEQLSKEYSRGILPLPFALWLIPAEPLELPATLPLSRLLVEIPPKHHQSEAIMLGIRKLVTSVPQQIPVHLHKSAGGCFCQTAAGSPEWRNDQKVEGMTIAKNIKAVLALNSLDGQSNVYERKELRGMF